jgi:hypothetical protein
VALAVLDGSLLMAVAVAFVPGWPAAPAVPVTVITSAKPDNRKAARATMKRKVKTKARTKPREELYLIDPDWLITSKKPVRALECCFSAGIKRVELPGSIDIYFFEIMMILHIRQYLVINPGGH